MTSSQSHSHLSLEKLISLVHVRLRSEAGRARVRSAGGGVPEPPAKFSFRALVTADQKGRSPLTHVKAALFFSRIPPASQMVAVLALFVLAAVGASTLRADHAPPDHAPSGHAPSLEPADGRRGARAFRIPAPYRPLVHIRPEAAEEDAAPPPPELLAGGGCRQGEKCDTTPQHTQELIEKFLKELAASTRDRPPAQVATPIRDHDNKIDPGNRLRPSTEEPTNRLASLYLDNEEAGDKSSTSSDGHSWSLLESKSHRHPYDDRDGWVTLEAVPWAAAKVAKWKPNPGRRPPWVTLQNSYGGQQSSPPHDRWERPQPTSVWHRPAPERPPAVKPSLPADPYEYLAHHHGDIVTDQRPLHRPPWAPPPGSAEIGEGGGGSVYGLSQPHHQQHGPARPGYIFPEEPSGLDSLHRHHYHQPHHPPSYPGEADGEWVLLSSTKGYSLPSHRRLHQRAVSFSARPVTSRRSVRLTVLPAQNGTTNTSTSHGGLLEVHSSFNSVEQDVHDREHDQQNGLVPAQDIPVFTGVPARPTLASVPVLQGVGSGANLTTQFGIRPLQQQLFHVVPGRKGTKPNPGRALLAAVGAGVLPATVAMLVPLALGRRRRRSIYGGEYTSKDWLLVPDTTTFSREQTASARRPNQHHQKRF
ncbi:uncharacterized protein LOC126210014 [Schistocerca nitens]|uniref:uncharacterized protein LOC126210014 n=1 Tax=Schistocerca nitens TaxID=7011 RepID=UPI0021197994|nr:uncharacterized protein LOC126210014 [Schistocerca nitens]